MLENIWKAVSEALALIRSKYRARYSERKKPLDRASSPNLSDAERLVIRLCEAMGWKYEVMLIEKKNNTPFVECTATIACWVWPGCPQYGQSLIDSFRRGEVAVPFSTYAWTPLGQYADRRTLEDWIELTCREWLDGLYGNYWYPSKRIMNYRQGGRFPASSDEELELWLAANGV